MAELLGTGQLKLNNGQVITPQQGGWYDARQYWGGTLSDPGVINSLSTQQGAGQPVSKEVVQQTNPANWDYIQQQRAAQKLTPTPAVPATTPPTTPSPGTTGAGAGTGTTATISAPATINLPNLYNSLYASSGISDLEKQLSDQTKSFTEAKGKINDNPFLSEATRVGRVAKLESLFAERTTNLRNDISTKKADIETRLNLETKQFDINSQAAKQALDQFNTLLSIGALDGASGDDIANITKSTGLSSTAIQAAITASKAKNVKTQVITSTADDGTVTASVINTETGQVIKQTDLGKIGNVQQGRAATETEKKQTYMNLLKNDAQRGVTLAQIFNIYSGYLDPNEILNLYNSSSMYGPAKESEDELKKYGVKPMSSGGISIVTQP